MIDITNLKERIPNIQVNGKKFAQRFQNLWVAVTLMQLLPAQGNLFKKALEYQRIQM